MTARSGPPSAIARHRWSEPRRYEHKSERDCLNGCGIVKVSHHEGDAHWIDFWRDAERIASDHTPPCKGPADGSDG